ncbi:enoyl-CoA hydratase-related protein [Desulfosudis oleivorans]|uniref:Enoyl-CoA hydratase/isomerase n=1 Tax=Desulfosudis oleivorans (strain DSM 6200 / JCM 39069 / Hxd3) TaxID=96561 RepID=A8ZUW2_DESOH|nr:enoyl-CoA hydratase-related protein [Desulfosudis oleivorans]ABW68052.1 Enoyl-CoA hydratase/isomerase [Desulfosudis oleivorans Hxd3]
MSYKTILLDINDSVATITLNRPEAMNAWNPAMSRDLGHALAALDKDDTVRAVVITGAGRAFCAGADLSGAAEAFDAENREDVRAALAFPAVMPYQIRKPVLAAINGHAIGVGITFSMTCDIRIVAEDAKIQFAFVRRGLTPELASHVIVPRIAGLSVAADLMLSGRIINGREMARLGLASEALPAADVLPATLERARDYKNAAPVSVAITKHLLWQGLTASIPEMDDSEFTLFQWVCCQPDAAEGVISFLEKRAPDWKMSASKDLPDLLGDPLP